MPDWLSYERYDKGKNATVFVDFDAELDAAGVKSRFTASGTLNVSGFATDADGTPADAAAADLFNLQGAIESALGDEGSVAVCIACAGTYSYVVYAATKPLGMTLQPLAPPSWTSDESWTNDPAWSTYDGWALQGEERETARDNMQLADLKNRLPDLPDLVTFTFDLEFHGAEAAVRAHAAFEKAGYDVPLGELEEGGRDGQILYADDEPVVRVNWTGKPNADDLSAARRQISAIADEFGGVYLGWGTEVDLEVTP